MFLQHIENTTSLKPDPETGVLVKFPLAVKTNIIKSILSVLIDPNKPKNLLHSTFSIKWIMECSGCSFSLPAEQHKIIEMGVTLYQDWLFGKNTPPHFHENQNRYFREIFGHFSLLFKTRRADNLSTQKHVELCLKVIQIISDVGFELHDKMDKETWEYLLNILIGICDFILAGKNVEEPILTNKLAPYLLKV
ncbi:hypothetical protein M0813_19787 [Anaeramoeba flamelloides]|uniref:Ral GTPase-activating protein subunit alpha/beta N-terminal domain-containing protein n=1 Tax=Anaeramoeba flamelloides TaxID=1746091 RepID=A0ABQ8YNC5_9EUKA|nr:hypothetical protein M0813_19787 [Anaeramoeba flamelloides]